MFHQLCQKIALDSEIKSRICSLRLSNGYGYKQLSTFFSYVSLDQFSNLQALSLDGIDRNSIWGLIWALPHLLNLRHFNFTASSDSADLLFKAIPMSTIQSLSMPTIEFGSILIEQFTSIILENLLASTPNLESLTILAYNNNHMIDGNRWQQLIEFALPHLDTFKFKFEITFGIKNPNIVHKLQQFQSDFWYQQHHCVAECLNSFILLRAPLEVLVAIDKSIAPAKVINIINNRLFFHDIENLHKIMQPLAYAMTIIQSSSITLADCYLILSYLRLTTDKFVVNTETQAFGKFVGKVVDIRFKEFQNDLYLSAYYLHPKYCSAGMLTVGRSAVYRCLAEYSKQIGNNLATTKMLSVLYKEDILDLMDDSNSTADIVDDTNNSIDAIDFMQCINDNHHALRTKCEAEHISEEQSVDSENIPERDHIINTQDRDYQQILMDIDFIDENQPLSPEYDEITGNDLVDNGSNEDYDVEELLSASMAK
ncbi:unnamed protein product [Rotaria sordida]|uniref:Uncharacterized protein n=1 Tax=Rotaria sordida TaxID=392033 RepID=A0A814ISF2_9BILA|nr:unnamed protein product [Rotaria sordida]CAF4013427.1 unnamed protein product [Rotaria sordida]